jgi:hypothetical protein
MNKKYRIFYRVSSDNPYLGGDTDYRKGNAEIWLNTYSHVYPDILVCVVVEITKVVTPQFVINEL